MTGNSCFLAAICTAAPAGVGGESTKARFHASLGQRKIPLGGTWRGKMAKTYSELFVLKVYQHMYRSQFSVAAGNRHRPAAISAGKRNATPVQAKIDMASLNRTLTVASWAGNCTSPLFELPPPVPTTSSCMFLLAELLHSLN